MAICIGYGNQGEEVYVNRLDTSSYLTLPYLNLPYLTSPHLTSPASPGCHKTQHATNGREWHCHLRTLLRGSE